jgi:phospholipid/cholesterol/gamma-HCH transport system permease protein
LIPFISRLGGLSLLALEEPLALCFFSKDLLISLFKQVVLGRLRLRQVFSQIYLVAIQSLPVVVFSLTFISLIMIVEFSFHMKKVLQNDSLVPAFSTLMMLRELGPVVTCLLLTSRVGAGMAAELGTMKVTDQIDALQLLSVDVMDYLVLPRWIACVFSSICLCVVAVAVAILGGAFISSIKLGIGFSEFLNTTFVLSRFNDGIACVIKAAIFGTVLPLIACFHGLRAKSGSQGVGTAATSAVVQGSILIIIADFVVTYVLYKL